MAYKRKTIDIGKQGNAKFIQMSREYEAPIIKVDRNYEIIKYGDNNNYPELLLELLASSGLHRSIVDKKVSMILGKGLDLEVNEKTQEFILHPNPYEDLMSIMEKRTWDLETFGGFYLQIIWNPNDDTINEIYHMQYDRMRVSKPNEFGFAETAFFYDDLTLPVDHFYDIQNTISFPIFSENVDKSEPQIFHAFKYTPTNKYYGAACYEGSTLDIQTYSEVSNFNNSNLKNNFSPGFLILFSGQPPSEELQDSIVQELRVKYAGTENTGTPLLFFLEEGMDAPEIKPMEVSDLDKQFAQLIKQIIDNIVVSHQIPRQVVGLATAGSLGSSKEMLEATQIFKSSYIEPQQNVLLSVFNTLGLINQLDELKLIKISPNIMMFDMTDLSKILSQNELREYLGYEELEENEVINEEEKEVINEEIDEKNNEIEDGE